MKTREIELKDINAMLVRKNEEMIKKLYSDTTEQEKQKQNNNKSWKFWR